MRKKKKTEVEKVVDQLPAQINVNSLYNEFIGLTSIEKYKEEDFVLRSLIRGQTRSWILEQLKKKHPDGSFTINDFEKFLAKNQEVMQAMGKDVELAARRMLNAKEQCSNMLAGVAFYTQNLIKDFKAEGDNTNTVAAIRALNQTLENYMKLEGMTKPEIEGGKVVNVIQGLSAQKNSLKDQIHNANFIELEETTGSEYNG